MFLFVVTAKDGFIPVLIIAVAVDKVEAAQPMIIICWKTYAVVSLDFLNIHQVINS